MNNKIKHCKLGLDIGVSSVGYAVLNFDNDVIDAGVRIFSERSAKNNAERREHRHNRRLHRRRVHRLERMDRLFHRYNICNKNFYYICEKNKTPYDYRVKGLTEQLTLEQIAIAIRHIAKHRGLQEFSLNFSGKDTSKEEKSTKAKLESKRERLEAGLYPCEIQLEELRTNGSVRGTENVFFTKDFEREAKTILYNQQKYYPEIITNEFIDEVIELIVTRREYFEGPGTNSTENSKYGENSKSPYGWSSQKEWMENLRGECTYCEGETRIAKGSPTLELYNVLNDLNNLLIDGEHLTKEQKEFLIENLFKTQKTTPALSSIIKKLKCDKDAVVSGYRIDNKDKPLFSSMTGYYIIAKCSESTDNSIDMNDFILLDKIADIVNTYQTPVDISEHLQKDIGCSKEFSDAMSLLKDSTFKGTASLSKKAILLILDELYNTTYNATALFHLKNISTVANTRNFQEGQLPLDIFDKAYVSPVVKKSFKQTLIVYNMLSKKYEFDAVTIEMAREKNSEDKRKFIQQEQKKNGEINDKVDEIIHAYGQMPKGNLKLKIKLWLEQDQTDIYTGEKISIDDLLNNPQSYEIDHIIPLSISFDDSLKNKVLTHHKNNQSKGQRTPYYWLSKEEFTKYQTRVLDLKDRKLLTTSKVNNLLFKDNINKWEIQRNFINRNLVDTRYTTKEILSLFKTYFKSTGANTKVYNINGNFTSYVRKICGLQKDRDADLSHHAIDAMIIAISPFIINSINKFNNIEERIFDNETVLVDKFTGEVIEDEDYKNSINPFRETIKKFAIQNIKYDYNVEKKFNQQFTNETLYSTRIIADENGNTTEYKVSTIKNIYEEKDVGKLYKLFNTEDCEKLLMFQHDIRTFTILKDIFNEYYIDDKTNPFEEYRKTNGYIKKYSKKGNGPIVKSLKYFSSKINGKPLDISKKQGVTCENKRVIQDTFTTHHIEVYSNGITQKIIIFHHNDYRDKILKEGVRENLLRDAGIDESFKLVKKLYEGTKFMCDGKEYVFTGYHCRASIWCVECGLITATNLNIGKKHCVY